MCGVAACAERFFATEDLPCGLLVACSLLRAVDGVKEQIWNLDSDGVYSYAFGAQTQSDDTTQKLTGKKKAIKTGGIISTSETIKD